MARRSTPRADIFTLARVSDLALAALNRVVAPCSKLGFADWWKTTAADRFTKIGASVWDHRRFWDAMHAVSLAELAEIERRVTATMIERFDLDPSALALDMTPPVWDTWGRSRPVTIPTCSPSPPPGAGPLTPTGSPA